jgi:colanic acid biosynthesis glycosyl transferase WcaI
VTPSPSRESEPAEPHALVGARIALVGINYAPETTGIGPYTTAMAHAWADAGAQVHVVTGVPHYPRWTVGEGYDEGRRWVEQDGDVRVVRVRHHVPAVPDLRGRARMEASFGTAARRELRSLDVDVVVAVTPSLSGLAAAAAGRRRVPVGVVVQDLSGQGAAESGSASSRVAAAIGGVEYALLRRADAVGVITPRFRELVVERGVSEDAVVDVANFTHVRASDRTRDEAADALGWPRVGLRIVHTGNMGRKQGLEHVVEAARLAAERGDDVEIVLVGDGNMRQALEAAGACVPTLRMVGLVSDEDYPTVLAAADLLLLHERPGVREMCLPSKLTSYTAAGRPLLAAVEPGGISASVLERAGAAHVLPPGDPLALLDAALELGRDPARRAALADAARAHGEATYGRDAARQRYVAFAERLLDGREGSTPGRDTDAGRLAEVSA